MKQEKILKAGVDHLAKAVIITLGQGAATWCLKKMDGPPQMSCDGVTVAECVIVKKPEKKENAIMAPAEIM